VTGRIVLSIASIAATLLGVLVGYRLALRREMVTIELNGYRNSGAAYNINFVGEMDTLKAKNMLYLAKTIDLKQLYQIPCTRSA
jgi:hypothetical protein